MLTLGPVVAGEGSSSVSPLTPGDLLIALHNIDSVKCDMKSIIKGQWSETPETKMMTVWFLRCYQTFPLWKPFFLWSSSLYQRFSRNFGDLVNHILDCFYTYFQSCSCAWQNSSYFSTHLCQSCTKKQNTFGFMNLACLVFPMYFCSSYQPVLCGEECLHLRGPSGGDAAADGAEPSPYAAHAHCHPVSHHVSPTGWICHEHPVAPYC